MEPNSLVFMEGFTLQESMSALEVSGPGCINPTQCNLETQIGEPRLDTGLIIQEQVRPPFNPSQSLLPEEICWILDRALAFEVSVSIGIVSLIFCSSCAVDRILCWKFLGAHGSYPPIYSLSIFDRPGTFYYDFICCGSSTPSGVDYRRLALLCSGPAEML